MKSRILTATVLALGLTTLSSGTQAAALADIYELSVQNDPEIAAARADYQISRTTLAQRRALLLPSVSASVSTSKNTTTGPTQVVDGGGQTQVFTAESDRYSHNWGAQLTQPIFDLSRFFQWRQGKHIEANARHQFKANEQALIFRVADNYFSILEAEDRVVAARAEREAVSRQLEQVQQRFDVGLVAITDVLDATASYDNSTVSVIEAEGAQVVTFETLLRLTGQPYSEVISLAQDFPVQIPEPRDEEAWVKLALEGNLQLKQAEALVSSAKQGLRASRSNHAPRVNASISYGEGGSRSRNTIEGVEIGSGIDAGDSESLSGSLTATIPIFNGGSMWAQDKQSRFQLESANKNLDLTRRNIVEQTRNLYSALTTDVARVKARARAIESNQSALDATQTGYEVGTRNIVDVLVGQQRLFSAQFAYAQARYQYIRDVLRLKQIVGQLSPEDIYQLDQYISGTRVTRSQPST